MDHKAFQTDPQTTLIAVCFVSLLPSLLSVLRQTSEEHFQEQKGTRIAAANLALGHTGNLGIVSPPFIHLHLISAPIHGPKCARSARAFFF